MIQFFCSHGRLHAVDRENDINVSWRTDVAGLIEAMQWAFDSGAMHGREELRTVLANALDVRRNPT